MQPPARPILQLAEMWGYTLAAPPGPKCQAIRSQVIMKRTSVMFLAGLSSVIAAPLILSFSPSTMPPRPVLFLAESTAPFTCGGDRLQGFKGV